MQYFPKTLSQSYSTYLSQVFGNYLSTSGASLVAQMVKKLPAMWETQVQSLGQEDPLEEEMVTHSSILAQRIPWTEEPDGLQSVGSQGVRHDRVTNTLVHGIVIFSLLFKIYNSFFTVKCALHPTFIGSMFSTRWKLWESRNCHIVPYVYSSPQHLGVISEDRLS